MCGSVRGVTERPVPLSLYLSKQKVVLKNTPHSALLVVLELSGSIGRW